MPLSKFVSLLIVSLFLIPSFSFAKSKEDQVNLGILSGYQYYFKNITQQYHLIVWDDNIATLRRALSLTPSPIDLLLLSKKTAEQACNLGLLISLPDDPLSPYDKECDFKTFTDHIALAWDSQKIYFQPTWRDFWNVTQYPGRRGLQKDAFSALSIALLADGVPPGDVVEALSTSSGILRAFKKLNQLRPYIVWWTTPNDANFLLYKKRVLMSSVSVLSISAFQKQHPSSRFQYQHKNTIETSVVLSIPSTIPTQRIKTIQDLLAQHSLLPVSLSHPKYRLWQTSIKPETILPQKSSVSLDEIFDEWLELPQ